MKKVKLTTCLGAALLGAGLMVAEAPIVSFSATTDNVAGAHDSLRIDVPRWSTDSERDQMVLAWTNPGAPSTGGRAGKGRGAAVPAADPFAAGNDAPIGGSGRAGRGGASPTEAARPTPESSLTAALAKAPSVGYLWSSEVTGYSLRYAVRVAVPDGGERIILITDRRLGAWNDLWKPVGSGTPTNYEFSVIELRLNPKGEGEGKVSLTGKVAVDSAAKTIALESYSALPVVLKNVRRK